MYSPRILPCPVKRQPIIWRLIVLPLRNLVLGNSGIASCRNKRAGVGKCAMGLSWFKSQGNRYVFMPVSHLNLPEALDSEPVIVASVQWKRNPQVPETFNNQIFPTLLQQHG